MNISLQESEANRHALHTAILLYGADRTAIAVQHPVIVERAGARLGAGTFVTQGFVEGLLSLFQRGPLTYVPANVVATSHSAIVWYEPAATRTMFFKPSTDHAVAAFDSKPVPQPPLLFIARSGGLSVYALSRDERPTLETPLCKAPYWNVFANNDVCLGSMVLPKSIEPSDTGKWTAAFFSSNFTHLSATKCWRRSGTYAELLTAAVAAGTFDPAWLMPTDLTVEKALCGR